MTKMLVEYQLNDGTVATFEVEAAQVGRVVPSARGDGTVAQASQKLEEAIARIRPAAQAVVAQLNELKADEVEVAFGLKLGAETGVIIAAGSVEAHYTVKLAWKGNSRKPQDTPELVSNASTQAVLRP